MAFARLLRACPWLPDETLSIGCYRDARPYENKIHPTQWLRATLGSASLVLALLVVKLQFAGLLLAPLRTLLHIVGVYYEEVP